MTQEEKKLLQKDLCARLPYEVQCEIGGLRYGRPYTFTGNDVEDLIAGRMFKPYLHPLSSMTEEEEEEYWNIINSKSPEIPAGEIPSIEVIAQCSVIVLDWLLSKGFDIRGLIPKGLVLEAL